jgi:hypothetical protein
VVVGGAVVRALTLALWGALVGVAIVLEVLGRRRVDGLLPGEEVLRTLRAMPAARVVVLVGWMWLGWHLFVR